MISTAQLEKFEEYRLKNSILFSNPLIRKFFENEDNIVLILKTLDGDSDSQNELEITFRKYFFRIRFVKFLVSTIKFVAIDQMRIHQKRDKRDQLIFDRPVSENGESTTLGELLVHSQIVKDPEICVSDPLQFQSSFTNENLANAFAMLSQKQQMITTLCYALCYQDNEISKILGVSPQAVCKTRNLALQKLRLAMPERR
ncbi:hypothetical protein ACFQZT_15125 [Paenibacillus sp. GCM10027628]|uniref:hypothetical protein n=1 Tax=Paenibacillus sp. GCM10027628 TaxID=3273413 RepID=UPI0036266C60